MRVLLRQFAISCQNDFAARICIYMCCEDGLRELLNEDASLREKLMPAMSDELLRRLTGEKELRSLRQVNANSRPSNIILSQSLSWAQQELLVDTVLGVQTLRCVLEAFPQYAISSAWLYPL